MRVVLIATHPIQYHIPWYRGLSMRDEIELTVLYALVPDAKQQGTGFGMSFEWDIALLEGYDYEVLVNTARRANLSSFFSGSTPTIRRKLRQLAPDAVILTGWHSWPLLQGFFAARRRGIPVLVRGDSRPRPRPMWVREAHRWLLRNFAAFLAVGSANRAFYMENGVSAGRVFEVPHFVENQRFQQQLEQANPNRGDLRASWDIPEGSVCFLFAGKLIPKKRITDLLAALEQARKRNRKINLLVVGAGEQKEIACKLVRDRELPVSFAGFLNQTEITNAYAAADCLVLPSDWGETWGLVVNEGMACGLPAITSDRVGCALDLIREGETGFTFPFGDIEALADRLIAAAADPAGLRQMGAAARRLVSEQYTVEAAVEGTLRALRSVVPA